MLEQQNYTCYLTMTNILFKAFTLNKIAWCQLEPNGNGLYVQNISKHYQLMLLTFTIRNTLPFANLFLSKFHNVIASYITHLGMIKPQ